MKKSFLLIALAAVSLSAAAQQWAPVGETIRTEWASEINPECPLPEYPRPQMVRSEWQNLNGMWSYAVTGESEQYAPQGSILVPYPLESSLSGVGKRLAKNEALWYERQFVVPRKWKGKNVMLHFGAVDWHSEVYVNGTLVGEHKGGYDPFSFDITPYLKKSGKQTLRLKVKDATDNGYQPRGKQVNNPQGIWYTPVSGIWQTVWMEPVAKSYVESYYVVSDIDNAVMQIEVAAQIAEGEVVKVEVLDGGVGYSAEAPSQNVIAEAVAEGGKAVVNIPDMKTWSPDSPYLYGIKVSVLKGDKVIDSVQGYTAMRKVSMKKDSSLNKYKRLALNNEILFHFGPLDQGWWPDGLYTAPTDEALKFDIVKTKEMGFNMIRKHIKVEPARWYYYCDLYGMMVWQDMPSIADHSKGVLKSRDKDVQEAQHNKWSSDSFIGGTDCKIPQEWKDNFYREWENIMNALKGFQSIVVWVPFNEAWGQFDTPDVVRFTKALDSTRLVNCASGGNYDFSEGVEGFGDILDVHHYPCPAMNIFEAKFINVLGEYGGIGYPVSGHLWKQDSNWGYGKVKSSSEEVMKQYEDYLEMLKVFVTTGCAAAVYTQTTDVEIEVNGLMTYDRAVIKVDIPRISAANKAVIDFQP